MGSKELFLRNQEVLTIDCTWSCYWVKKISVSALSWLSLQPSHDQRIILILRTATFILFLATILLPIRVCAEDIYRNNSEQGAVIYSNRKENASGQPHKLPSLIKVPKLDKQAAPLSSCVLHGGINCALGRDQDGSVVCYDGFRDAAARFLFNCSDAKLIAYEIDSSKQHQPDGFLTIYVRNETSVIASGVKVNIKRKKQTLPTSGPEAIGAHEMGTYIFAAPAPEVRDINLSFDSKFQLSLSQIEIKCNNCF